MSCRLLARLGVLLGVVHTLVAPVHAQTPSPGVVVIEAEDFNFGSGQHLPISDVMPYLGGAYDGRAAVYQVDYFQPGNEPSSDQYRINEKPNVPMIQNSDMDRGTWTMTTNYRIGWTDPGDWYNYTRVFPAGYYRAFAALSFDGTSPGQLHGTLQRVTSGATNANQTLQQLGVFDAPGSGGWGLNNLVPLKDANGKLVTLEFDGATTLRYTATSADIDYYKFVPLLPPRFVEEPADLTVMEGDAAALRAVLGDPVGAVYQWQSNRVDIPKATGPLLTLSPAPLAADGARYRCVVTNALGSAISREATLRVTPDIVKPAIVLVQNIGTTTLMVVFSEPVAPGSALVPANYTIEPGIAVNAVAAGADNRTVLLTTAPLTFGTSYELIVNNVQDRAVTPNTIERDARRQFLAVEFAPVDIGGPAQPGRSVPLAGGFDLTGSGADFGGATDQLHFDYQRRTGDFDLQARVAGLEISDPFVHAGLMARESLDAGARFAAVFASSASLGCFFSSRPTVGTAAVSAGAGIVPVNYPQTWLRLRRAGAVLTGYASLDGRSWVQLGSRSFSSLTGTLFLGMSVTSENPARAATVQFRDVGPTASTAVGVAPPPSEPLAPSNRRTGLVLSEIMYHPPRRADGKKLEFVEVYNAGAVFEDLTGYRLSGDVDYAFPAGFRLGASEFVVVAAAPDDLRAVYGIENVLGPLTGALPNDQGRVRLRSDTGAIRLEVNYGTEPPWPVSADGAGHSLVLARPSYGEDDPRAWAASEVIGGSPGRTESVRPAPQRNVVINEFLAHTDLPQLDTIELYNHSNASVDLSGCILTDDPSTNKFRFPPDTSLAAGGFLACDENLLGFRLDAAGETIYFKDAADARILDAVRFGGQENGVSTGRSPDGSPTFRRLSRPTLGAANAPWRSEDVVLNEIMFNPISGEDDDQYIELFNLSADTVDLSRWRFVAGVDFTLPANTTLAAGGYLVVAKNRDRLLANYPQLNLTNTVGNFGGSLAKSGERLALAKPDTILGTNDLGEITTNLIHITVAEVTYGSGGRWGRWADGGGSSLELIDPHADPLRAANWAGSDETRKGEWTTFSTTGVLDNGHGDYPPNRLHITMEGEGECQIDEVSVSKAGGANLVSNGGFEAGSPPGATGWSFFGNHSKSGVDTVGASDGSRCLHVRGQGGGDTGINSIRTALAAGLAQGNTATITAKARWVAGWPEVLFRTRGNWLELFARLPVPRNLGTPGLVNSRAVTNAGPAIFDVTHTPALPRANQSVVITCRVSDPDGIGLVRLRYRVDPTTSLTAATMHDDGVGGDAVAGDGVYSMTLSGRAAGTLIAFRIEATDTAGGTLSPASSLFPPAAPAQECLIRWEDPVPFGTFTHYHLWSTQSTESSRQNALDNTARDATLVYGNSRVIYNVGFRDKGSPFHGGAGDLTVTVPPDDLLLGTPDRVFASTGNGGSEPTAIRSQLAAWLAKNMGIPYLHAHYIQLYRNGGSFREVMEDLEYPRNSYAEYWFPDGGSGDLHKVAVWFEFQDDNSGFGAVGATLDKLTTTGGAYKLARYRRHYPPRPKGGTANDFTNVLDLVTAANATVNYPSALLNLADLDEWMRVFAYHRAMGNWDSWSFGVGQNMFIFKQPGGRFVLLPWDIDFTFGLGNGPNDGLWGGQDGVINRMFDVPAIRRMLWRGYIDAVNGPMLPENYAPQIEARRAMLRKNAISGLGDPSSIYTYIEQRREFLVSQIKANDAASFAITSNNGNDFTSATPVATLEGAAPFAVAAIEVNGVPYPVNWIDFTRWQLKVPLTAVTNLLSIRGLDRLGAPVDGAADSVKVIYRGAVPQPQDYVRINEIHYHSAEPKASFLELYNSHATVAFDLSNFLLKGVGYQFPEGAIIPAGGFLVLVQDRAGFNLAYGSNIPVFDQFPGTLDNGGERLALVKPGPAPAEDLVISDVRYHDRLPWPTEADGGGSSLQLVDARRDGYRAANWAARPTNDVNRVTPGRANSVRQSLPAFPLLWLNEVMPNNVNGPTNNAGERSPWLELYNAGASVMDLSALYLTDTYTNLTRWQFPLGTVIEPNQFLVVWADGNTGQSAAGAPHTSFRLNPTNGSVALVWNQGSPAQPAVLDYLDYRQLPAGRSLGSYPDGEPRKRRTFYFPTPAATNDPTFPPVDLFLNEFMAGNTQTLADPADGHFDDWFEIYNAGANTVDLTGYTLTDDLTNITQYVIPPGYTVAPGGFLLVWADNDTKQNSPTNADLHVNFKLALAGEQLGLFSPDGLLVDGFSFPAQTNDVSMGRVPDGGELPLAFMPSPTPRGPNIVAGANRPPVLAPIGNLTVAEETLLAFTARATDADEGQHITYSLSPDAPPSAAIDPQTGEFAWTPTEAEGPGVYSFAVRATDDGLPPRAGGERITVTVTEVNRPPVIGRIDDQVVNEGSLLVVNCVATDADRPLNRLAWSLENGPPGAAIDPATGRFAWTPSEADGGQDFSVSVSVTDDGTPPLSQSLAFRVSVFEVDNPPVLAVIQSQTVDELDLLTVTVSAVDPDDPGIPILFSLDVAPEGAAINPTTGVITWRPTEAQGPTNAVFVVRATSGTPPGLSDVRTFGVTVREVNQQPRLAALADYVLAEGATLSVTNAATDDDLPPQALIFTLDPGAPAGMAVDPVSGVLSWTVGADQGASTNLVTVRVTDTASPPLSEARSFTVVVRPQPHVVFNEIMYRPAAANAEFIELHNNSTNTTENLGGLRLSGRNLSATLPSGLALPPGGFVVVVKDRAAFALAYTNQVVIAAEYAGDLGRSGDELHLVRPGATAGEDVLVAAAHYSDAPPWPAAATGAGGSLQLIDPHRDVARAGNWAALAGLAPNQPRTLILMTNVWSYDQSGNEPDPNWNQPGFDDSEWPAGPALLYWESADLPAPKSTPLTLGKLAYYFRTRFQFNGATNGVALKITTVLDDGAAFYLNGRLIFALGIDTNAPINSTSLASRTVGDAVLEGPFVLPPDGLRQGENVLAVEVHQTNPGSSDIVFGMTLEVEGGLLTPYTPGAENSVRADLAPFPNLWLNEVLPNNQTGLADASGARGPWVELFNAGPTLVSLAGCYLTDAYNDLGRWAFPANAAIEPGAFAMIWADGRAALPTPGEWHTSFRLAGPSGALALVRAQEGGLGVIDYLNYEGAGPDQSYGSLPDGQAGQRSLLPAPTPGASNLARPLDQPPVLRSAGLTAEAFPTFAWASIEGRTYQVEFKDTLSAPAWQPWAQVVANQTTVVFVDFRPSPSATRFYRVRLE